MTASAGAGGAFANAFNQSFNAAEGRRLEAQQLNQQQSQFASEHDLAKQKMAAEIAKQKGLTLEKQAQRQLTQLDKVETGLAAAIKERGGSFLENPTNTLTAYEKALDMTNATLAALGQPPRQNMFKSIVESTSTREEVRSNKGLDTESEVVAKAQGGLAAAPTVAKTTSIAADAGAADAVRNASLVGATEATVAFAKTAAEERAKAEAKASALPEDADIKDVNKVRNDFVRMSDNFIKRKESAATLSKSLDAKSAVGDLAAIFAFMKMVDPGSTVREGEQATARNAGGLIDVKTRGLYNRIRMGASLTPSQREDFRARGKEFFAAALENQKALEAKFRGIASRHRMDPRDIIVIDAAGAKSGQRRIIFDAEGNRVQQ